VTDSKPTCSLSLDLDNQWSYMKTHGDAGWEDFPSYLDLVVPRILRILGEFGWEITVFVVGQDAALEKNREPLQAITGAGHEIGNHSFNHEPWLHLYSKHEVRDEITRTEEVIEAVSGQIPRGFRGPGYSLSRATLEVLAERNYLYDASTFPTYLGPIARLYYFVTADLSKEERERRQALFGDFRDGFRPNEPFSWEVGSRKILEIPVTTMPLLKIPIHFSYLLYITTMSGNLAERYFRTALWLCQLVRIQPSLLLHPLDFLSGDDIPALNFFPAMNLPRDIKANTLYRLLKLLSSRYRPVTLETMRNEITES
jgi:peptidoglycan/xylan/chitin deacetylase (PgdA/CDA1 family)